uniref:Uncharacterized protein n=1 Tax=Arundo donax TaxID=35708 RepID=A0A0A9B252_ARUDO
MLLSNLTIASKSNLSLISTQIKNLELDMVISQTGPSVPSGSGNADADLLTMCLLLLQVTLEAFSEKMLQ